MKAPRHLPWFVTKKLLLVLLLAAGLTRLRFFGRKPAALAADCSLTRSWTSIPVRHAH